jgi:hypothetical protein
VPAKIVAGVDHHHQVVGLDDLDEAPQKAGRADSAGQNENGASRVHPSRVPESGGVMFLQLFGDLLPRAVKGSGFGDRGE